MKSLEAYAEAQAVFARTFPNEKDPADILEYFFQRLRETVFPGTKKFASHPSWENMLDIFLSAYEEADAMERKEGRSFLSRYPLRFLTDKEVENSETAQEYLAFFQAFSSEHIYFLLKLDRDLHGYSTLEHILGVHHLAMKIGRDLYRIGFPVDLGLLSGAAAGHDIGKYGVKDEDLHRIAYYHYYYTDLWFAERGMEYIRNIAVNHSTWDLEPESLSMESLLLIYSDFRVKNDVTGKMRFYTLEESFRVILDKLDDVDAAKERRYRLVYNKLLDFEKYLLHHGIEVYPEGESREPAPQKDPALRFGDELIDMIHLEGIRESTRMMHLLRSEESITRLFDDVLSSGESQDILRLLEALSDYSMYLTPAQKREILRYLKGMAYHSREDIRRRCSALRGQIVGEYDIVYRKEFPPEVLSNPMEREMVELFVDLLHEVYKPAPLMSQEKIILLAQDGYRSIIGAMERQSENVTLFKEPLLRVLMRPEDSPRRHLSYRLLDGLHRRGWLEESEAKRLNEQILRENPEKEDFHRTLYFNPVSPLFECSFREEGESEWRNRYKTESGLDTQQMYLDNLKTDTPEDIKAMSLEYLCRTCEEREDPLHLSLHMLNLIRVSSSRPVRRFAFNLVERIIPFLTKHQLNDVSIELLSALANEDPQSQEFLSELYGRILARLSHAEREEILMEIETMLKTSDKTLRYAMVKAVTYGLHHSLRRRDRVRGYLRILFLAMAHTSGRTGQLALVSLADQVFHAEELLLDEKAWVFSLAVKKIRLFTKIIRSRPIAGISYSYYLGSVYHFLSEYEMEKGKLELPAPERVALYFGSFDPMNLGQRHIVEKMCKEGYEVYVFLSEHAWNRRLYPYDHRRVIAGIHLAPIPGAYLMPYGYSFLPEREEDRRKILEDFAPAELSLLGSRDMQKGGICEIDVDRLRREDGSQWMKIRPSMIRHFIREGLDTTEMLDPLAAEYIARRHLYLSAQYEKAGEASAYEQVLEGACLQVKNIKEPRQEAKGKIVEETEFLSVSNIEDSSPEPLSLFGALISEAAFLASAKGKPLLRIEPSSLFQRETLKSLGYREKKGMFFGEFRKPLILIEDLPVRLQQEIREESALHSALADTRRKLHRELTHLYPGLTILPIPFTMLYAHHLRMIERHSQSDLLVPVSDVFYGQHFGGRRTKALHLLGNASRQEDNYLSVDHQLEVIAKFDARVLFVDDAAGLSQDFLPILPLVKKKGIRFEGLVSGVITPAYEEKLREEGVRVMSEYRLPEMRAIFFESDFFPFFGGRGLKTTSRGFRRVRNLIYPLSGASALAEPEGDFLAFSRRVLQMGYELMEELNRIYRQKYGHTLHMRDLFRIFDIVRVPELIEIRPERQALRNYEQLMAFSRSLQERWEGK